MNFSVTRTSLAPAVALLTALALGACAGGEDDDPETEKSSGATSDSTSDTTDTTDSTPGEEPGDGIGAADETFDEAVARIEEALASDDCDDISALAWGGGGDLAPKDVENRCAAIQKRFGTDGPTQAVAMGVAGGVVEFEPADRKATRAVLVADNDGLLRPIFFDYVNPDADDLAERGNGKLFTKAAEKSLRAMVKGDCDALAAVSHHERPRDWVCSVAEGSLAKELERKDRKLVPLGVSSDYALFGIQGGSVHWVVVMARQPKAVKSAARGYPDKKVAPTHVLAAVVKVAD